MDQTQNQNQSQRVHIRALVLLLVGLALCACAHSSGTEQSAQSLASPCQPHPIVRAVEDFRNDACGCKDLACVQEIHKVHKSAVSRAAQFECTFEAEDTEAVQAAALELRRCLESLVQTR